LGLGHRRSWLVGSAKRAYVIFDNKVGENVGWDEVPAAHRGRRRRAAGPVEVSRLVGRRLMPELSWGARVHAGGRRKPAKPVTEPPRAGPDGAGETGMAAHTSSMPLALDDQQMKMIMVAAEPVAASMRGAFLEAVALALRDRPITGATVREVCASVQRAYLAITVGPGGRSKYG
jgi:hypothetical protein